MCLKAAENSGSGQRDLVGCSCSPQGPCARPHSSSVEEKNKTQQCTAPYHLQPFATSSSLLQMPGRRWQRRQLEATQSGFGLIKCIQNKGQLFACKHLGQTSFLSLISPFKRMKETHCSLLQASRQSASSRGGNVSISCWAWSQRVSEVSCAHTRVPIWYCRRHRKYPCGGWRP